MDRVDPETLEILGDAEVVEALREAEIAVSKGDAVRGADEVRRLRGG